MQTLNTIIIVINIQQRPAQSHPYKVYRGFELHLIPYRFVYLQQEFKATSIELYNLRRKE